MKPNADAKIICCFDPNDVWLFCHAVEVDQLLPRHLATAFPFYVWRNLPSSSCDIHQVKPTIALQS